MGQYWRTETEFAPERQKELERCRALVPDIQRGIYPFKGMKLSRADMEWLLAIHENGRGPVDWSDESQRNREGLDLRGVDLRQVSLEGLPLARIHGGLTLFNRGILAENRELPDMAALFMEGANLRGTQLQGASLNYTQLRGADLRLTKLQRSYLIHAQLQDVDLRRAQSKESIWKMSH